jgi:large subunit ribosomal protein L18
MNDKNSHKRQKRALRHARVRAVLSGTATRPRLSVFRSASHIYAQLIDDVAQKTLASSSSATIKQKSAKTDLSKEVGKQIAEKGIAAGVTEVVFDRGGYQYHGRVKALAEGAREGGLKF